MKRTIFAIVIICLIIAAGVGEQIWLHRMFAELEQKTREVMVSVGQDDMREALKNTRELKDWWEARKHPLEAVVSHNETKEVTLRIAELEGYIAIDDQKSSYATAAILMEMSTNLPHLLGFSWDTVC